MRDSGYYWVRGIYGDNWQILYYDGFVNKWDTVIGYLIDSDFEEIDERKILKESLHEAPPTNH